MNTRTHVVISLMNTGENYLDGNHQLQLRLKRVKSALICALNSPQDRIKIVLSKYKAFNVLCLS